MKAAIAIRLYDDPHLNRGLADTLQGSADAIENMGSKPSLTSHRLPDHQI